MIQSILNDGLQLEHPNENGLRKSLFSGKYEIIM